MLVLSPSSSNFNTCEFGVLCLRICQGHSQWRLTQLQLMWRWYAITHNAQLDRALAWVLYYRLLVAEQTYTSMYHKITTVKATISYKSKTSICYKLPQGSNQCNKYIFMNIYIYACLYIHILCKVLLVMARSKAPQGAGLTNGRNLMSQTFHVKKSSWASPANVRSVCGLSCREARFR